MKESLFSARLFIRTIIVLLLIAMFIVTIQNSVLISRGNEQIQARQLETLTTVLITQAALTAKDMVLDEDQERLLQLTNQLATDRLVFDATVYNAEGIKLAASDNALSVREVLGLDTPLATANIGRQQLIEPIYHQQRLIGYIRMTFETGKVTAISDHHYRKSDRDMFWMILMSFTSGVLLTLMLKQYRNKKNKVENLLLKYID